MCYAHGHKTIGRWVSVRQAACHISFMLPKNVSAKYSAMRCLPRNSTRRIKPGRNSRALAEKIAFDLFCIIDYHIKVNFVKCACNSVFMYGILYMYARRVKASSRRRDVALACSASRVPSFIQSLRCARRALAPAVC